VQVCPDGKGNKYQEYQQIYGIFIGESRDAEYLCIGDGGLFSYFDYDDIESSLTTERFEDLKDYKRKLSEKQTGEKEIDKSINAECDFTYVNRGNFLCMKGVESYSGILGLVTPEQWNLWNGDIPQVYMIANYYMICEKSNHRVYLEEYFRKGEKTSDYDYSTAEAVEYCNKKLKAQYEAGDKRIHNNAEILKLFEEDNISKFTYEDYLSLDRDVYNTIVNICRD